MYDIIIILYILLLILVIEAYTQIRPREIERFSEESVYNQIATELMSIMGVNLSNYAENYISDLKDPDHFFPQPNYDIRKKILENYLIYALFSIPFQYLLFDENGNPGEIVYSFGTSVPSISDDSLWNQDVEGRIEYLMGNVGTANKPPFSSVPDELSNLQGGDFARVVNQYIPQAEGLSFFKQGWGLNFPYNNELTEEVIKVGLEKVRNLNIEDIVEIFSRYKDKLHEKELNYLLSTTLSRRENLLRYFDEGNYKSKYLKAMEISKDDCIRNIDHVNELLKERRLVMTTGAIRRLESLLRYKNISELLDSDLAEIDEIVYGSDYICADTVPYKADPSSTFFGDYDLGFIFEIKDNSSIHFATPRDARSQSIMGIISVGIGKQIDLVDNLNPIAYINQNRFSNACGEVNFFANIKTMQGIMLRESIHSGKYHEQIKKERINFATKIQDLFLTRYGILIPIYLYKQDKSFEDVDLNPLSLRKIMGRLIK